MWKPDRPVASYNVKADPEYAEIAEKNVDLKLEIEQLKKNLEEQMQVLEGSKDYYISLMKKQQEQINKLEDTILENKFTIEDLGTKLAQSEGKFKKFEADRNKNDTRVADLTRENKELKNKIENLESISEDKTRVIDTLQENLMRHEIESASLARKLAELKNAVYYLEVKIKDNRVKYCYSYF